MIFMMWPVVGWYVIGMEVCRAMGLPANPQMVVKMLHKPMGIEQ